MKKQPAAVTMLILLTGAMLIAGGIFSGEIQDIIRLGSRICLSCMGLGK